MDWKDAEKHMGDQGGTASSFSGEGYLGRHKAKGLSPNAEKSQVLQREGWRFCLLAHLLWFVFSNTDITELHPSWNLTRSPHSRLLPSGSCCTLDLGCRPREAWGHLLLGLRIPYQGRPCPPWCSEEVLYGFWCLGGREVRARRLFAWTLFQTRGLNLLCIKLSAHTNICLSRLWVLPFVPKAAVSHSSLFFYESSSLSWPNTLVFYDLIIIPRYLMSNEKDIF